MPAFPPDVIDAIHRPEYTGANRCIPCTAANAVIAAVVAIAIGATVATVSLAAGIASGAAALALFVATIYVRGYLVPGTPRLTRTYVPDWLLRRFEKPTTDDAAPPGAAALLEQAGIVTGDDPRLTDDFRDRWRERIVALRERDTLRGEAASFLDADPDALELEDYGTAFVAVADGSTAGRWESKAALLADLAATEVLRNRDGEWADRDPSEREALLGELRRFVDRCPSCDGAVTTTAEPVEGCCGSAPLYHVVTATCRSCGALLLEREDMG